ncbi:chemotaxis protein CheW [Pontibacter anaerobius]|uniref:Chemotaxis protein CheW n=1 Tax=Pontibacter anaerobius TaxID=2993940 RepID=A0ABT3RBJ6_9BACT|nr:chemotaxis protein CheW [Pontibacter anaerobius]MCX2739130.1 chemotaxis protein CheW [Pontibacter anaerobius]
MAKEVKEQKQAAPAASDAVHPETSKSDQVSEKHEASSTEATRVHVTPEMVHLIVFKLGTEEYAIRIDQVKEVTVTPNITRMPRTPDFVKGVANIRGDIIAIIDLEKRFNIKPKPEASALPSSYTLVVEADEYSIGIDVKEVPQSLNLALTKIDKTPSFLHDVSVNENFIEGIAKIDNRLIIVLDIHKILTQDEVNQLPNL